MESEKVKEIKKALEYCSNPICEGKCHYHSIGCMSELSKDSLTLINELESERREVAIKNHRLALQNIELLDENKQLKDRIAELEKEIEENAFYSKGYAQGIKNTYEVVIPDKLKQFAEMLKEKLFDLGNIVNENDIDETLKEFIDD